MSELLSLAEGYKKLGLTALEAIEHAEKDRASQLELISKKIELAKLQSTTSSPSEVTSALSLHPPNSALSEERGSLSRLKVFLSELTRETSVVLLANRLDAEPQADNDVWLQNVDGSLMETSEVRQMLAVPEDFHLSEADSTTYGLIHDPELLHRLGATGYQRQFDQQNASQRQCFLAQTLNTNLRIPIAKQHHKGMFRFSGKADNISMLRPMAIDFKGEKYNESHKATERLQERHHEVLERALRSAYSISRIQQYFGNIGVFAVCFDRLWLVWYQRKMVRSELRQQESINVIKLDPNSLGYFWAMLTKQALLNRNVMFVEGNDAPYLINFMNDLHPNLAHYCRTRFVSMSMNQVYAVTLPQLESNRSKTICISKNVKHFALKIIQSEEEYAQEVKCIARINEHIREHGVGLNGDNVSFYAIGSKKWGQAIQSYSSAIDFSDIEYSLERHIFSKEAQSEALKGFPSLDGVETPWWLYEPKPSAPLPGGVTVMLCGDYGQKVSAANIKEAATGASHWLHVYHSARVIHRDIRRSNIMRFDHPVYYTPFFAGISQDSTNNSALQWQLIDFNLGHCFDGNLKNERELIATTMLQGGSAQNKNAGFMVQQFIAQQKEESSNHHGQQLELIEYPWSFRDDRDMLLALVLKFIPTPITS